MQKDFLLVDDDKIFIFLTSKIIKKTGIASEIKTARNGMEALAIIEDCRSRSSKLPDFILLDINMPMMDGFEFLSEFKKLDLSNKENITIAIVSSSTDEYDVEQAKAFGIKYFFSKPLMEESLYKLLSKAHAH